MALNGTMWAASFSIRLTGSGIVLHEQKWESGSDPTLTIGPVAQQAAIA